VTQLVRASGGVIVRPDGADGFEVLIVHRPRYDDWSWPKGKALPGERDEECALREVEEETGLVCALGRELGSSSYTDARGRPKLVRYWVMRRRGGDFRPHAEVDEVRWLGPDSARKALSYERDRVVLDDLLSLGESPL
jgi:8-oxo-dGTP pyrophosphatase MutT (NUDIX family)